MDADEDSIEVTDFKESKSSYSETLYFTGGLVGIPAPGGGVGLIPVRGTTEVQGIPNLQWQTFLRLAAQCGSQFVGSNQTIYGSGAAPVEVWRPSFRPAPDRLGAADSWAAISHQAHKAADQEYERAARSFSLALHAAGERLRNVAKAHHDQLTWALEDGRKPGAVFSNTSLLSLHSEFQALATELCSARDHLARLAALAVSAKASVDSMVRLEDWVRKPANVAARHLPMVALLLAHWGSDAAPGWLRELGSIRNQMIHREPMAASSETRMLRMIEWQTDAGRIETIRLSPDSNEVSGQLPQDPFELILKLYNNLERLGREASEMGRYKPKLLNFVVRD